MPIVAKTGTKLAQIVESQQKKTTFSPDFVDLRRFQVIFHRFFHSCGKLGI